MSPFYIPGLNPFAGTSVNLFGKIGKDKIFDLHDAPRVLIDCQLSGVGILPLLLSARFVNHLLTLINTDFP